MKNERSISRGVWITTLLAIALSAFIVWNRFHHRPTTIEVEPPSVARQDNSSMIPAVPGAPATQVGVAGTVGERSGISSDLRPIDSASQSQLSVQVVTLENLPIAQAKLRILLVQGAGANQRRVNNSQNTDGSGSALVSYPSQKLDRLEITASDENYSSRKMVWDLGSGDTIPASYTLRLGGAISIAGVVVDVTNTPIPDAKISLHRFWSGGEDINKKGDQSDFPSQTVATDSRGRWSAKGLSPSLLDHISFDVSHPDFIGTNYTVSVNESQLRAGTFKTVLRRGIDALGRVTDEDDNPISGATVWAGRRFFRDRQETRTDAQGRFAFHNITDGEVLFSASATGRAPESKTFNVKSDMPEIIFKLKPGHVIRATVQDQGGAPISDVRVSLEGRPGEPSYDAYEFSAKTDSDGKFQWDGAPADPMPFYFGKQGYEQKRRVTLKPDQDNTVTLRNSRKLEGVVLDAKASQPVTNFSVRVGQRVSATSRVQGVTRNREFNAPDGRFTMDLDEENYNAVQVLSEDYATQTESFPEPQNGIVQVTVLLKPSSALKGTVLSPDGTPAPGVTVAITTGEIGGNAYLQDGRFRSMNWQSPVATTDSDGKFNIVSPPEIGTVLAAGSMGFGSASVSEVRANGVLVLQAYGRIDGTLKVGGVPTAGQDLLFMMTDRGISTDLNKFKVTTDEQGHFSFEEVPAGEGSIVRLVKTSENSWMNSHSTSVIVESGKTTQVSLGDSGALIKGIARFQTPATNGETLIVTGRLSTKRPPLPFFGSPEERTAYMNSPEWKAQLKQYQNFGAIVAADGSFQFDSIPPGDYTLTIEARKGGQNAFMGMPVAQGGTSVTVPNSANSLNPIFVGEIVLLPIKVVP